MSPRVFPSCVKKLEDGPHPYCVPEKTRQLLLRVPCSAQVGDAKHQGPRGDQRPDSAIKMLTVWRGQEVGK